jgi:polysaccharide export outer membrane protein
MVLTYNQFLLFIRLNLMKFKIKNKKRELGTNSCLPLYPFKYKQIGIKVLSDLSMSHLSISFFDMNRRLEPTKLMQFRQVLILLFFALPFSLTAQNLASAVHSTALPGKASILPLPTANPLQSDGYVLRVNDLIRITIFQEDDLLTETRISKSGDINFPLLGSITLNGKTVAEVTSEIRTRLDKDYIINPQVTLTILEYAQQWVSVLGEVQKPGLVAIPPQGGLDLLGAIALAGGYTRIADPSHIVIRRMINNQSMVIEVNAKKLARDVQVQQFIVQPGDSISVAESIW